MPDVFESRCLPELLETGVEADLLEDAVVAVGGPEEMGNESEPWRLGEEPWEGGGEEWEDKDDSELEVVPLEEEPNFFVDETRHQFFLILVERLRMELPVEVPLRDVGVEDLNRLLRDDDYEEYDDEVLADSIELVRTVILMRVVRKFLGPEGTDMSDELIREAVQSDVGADAFVHSPVACEVVEVYLVAQLVEYFEALAREAK